MILRNGKMIGTDQVIIDFDYASKMWRKNKIKYDLNYIMNKNINVYF